VEFEHEKLGKCVLKDLTQKDLEDFHEAMKGKGELSLTKWRGDSVRAFAKQGLIEEPVIKADEVDGLSPGMVYWLSECITKLQAEALNIDPLS
jgi:hypothetical protein